MKKITMLLAFMVLPLTVCAQNYLDLIAEGTHTVDHIVEVAELHFDSVGRERGTGYKPFRRWQYFAERAMDETGMLKSPEFYYNELQAYNTRVNNEGLASRTIVGTWEEMGPTYWNASAGWNPGVGRITSIAIEENNLNHIIAGANTGGVWRSMDGGATWEVLTDNLANIDVYALAIDPLVNTTYYWGSTGGSIFKSTDSGSTWTLRGSLPSGTVNKILIDPTNTQKLYASAQGSGLYKSIDGGTSWTIIDSGATTGYDFEFKPGDPNIVYASGSKFYKSTDGGATFSTDNGLTNWTQEFVSGNTSWTVAASNQNNTVTPKTGSGLGLFYIGNFTAPMTRLVTPSLDLTDAVNPQVNFSYTNVNWAGDIDELRVLYKTSAGGNWVQLAEYTAESTIWNDITINLPNPTADYHVAFEGTSNYGRGLTLDDISVQTNSGVVFTDGFESSSNALGSGPKMIGVSPADADRVYIVEASGGIFEGLHVSDNSGNSFIKRNHGTQNFFGYDSNGQDTSGQAPRDMDIAVNPNDADDVHIAGINTWRSTNAGFSFNITSQWTPSGAFGQNIGYCHADVDILLFAGSGVNTKLFVGSDGGIFEADDPTNVNFQYYTDLTVGMGIRQFYKIGVSQTDPVVVTGGSQDNGTSVLGADGNWTDWLGADGMEGFVDKNNSQIMYGTIQFGELNKTTNGGASRFGLTNPAGNGNWNWVVPIEQDPIIQNTVYVAYNQVFKSTNGGNTWVTASPNFGANIDHFKIAPTNSNKMYLAINGAFYYTNNGGINWLQSSSLNLGGGFINEIAVHPTNPDKIAIATTNTEKVYISSDGGQSWASIRWDLPNFASQALAWQDNGEDGLYVGMNYGVYYTDNILGNTWTPFSNGLPNVRINELEINTADGRIYAATYGRGLWRSNIYSASLSLDELKIDDVSMFPNPATNEVNLKSNKLSDVSIRIYNTLGKLMFYGKNLDLYNGLRINVSAFQSGVYFVKLNSEKGEITKKLILE